MSIAVILSKLGLAVKAAGISKFANSVIDFVNKKITHKVNKKLTKDEDKNIKYGLIIAFSLGSIITGIFILNKLGDKDE